MTYYSIVFVVLTPLLFFSEKSYGAKAAQVVTVSGVAKITAPGIAAKTLLVNDEVPEGAVITTAKGATTKLLFTDDTIMDIGSDSQFKVDEYKPGDGNDRKGLFSLAYGTIRSLVSKPVGEKGSYKVKTRDAVMGVRGTEFVVSAPFSESGVSSSSATTSIVVASGTVAIASAGSAAGTGGFSGSTSTPMSASVTAGQGFSTASSGGVAAQPQALSTGQMQNTMGSARVSDTTFTAAVSLDGGSSSGSKSEGGGSGGGNMALAAAVGAVGQTVSAGTGNLMGGINVNAGVPNGLSMRDVIAAPPVNILPGSQRTITVLIQ